MKYKILLLAFSAALFTGCSTAYKAGQTPDDVYYSPAREVVAKQEMREERRKDKYETYSYNEDDNYLRMRTRNRTRWSSIDDFDYWYDPNYSSYNNYRAYGYNPYRNNNWYSFYNRPVYGYGSHNPHGIYGNNYGYGSGNYGYGNSYGYGGGYYQPIIVIKNPVVNTNVSRPALSGYRNNNYSNNNRSNTNHTSFGEVMNRVFSPNNNNTYSNSNSSRSNSDFESSSPSRIYNPSSGSSNNNSGGSSSGSSGNSNSNSNSAPARPPRNGGN